MSEEYVEIAPSGKMKYYGSPSRRRKLGKTLLSLFPRAGRAIIQYEKPRYKSQLKGVERGIKGAAITSFLTALEGEKLLAQLRKKQMEAESGRKSKEETPKQYIKRVEEFIKAIDAQKLKLEAERQKLKQVM